MPTIFDYAGAQRKKCFCSIEHANHFLQNCCSVRYSLNFLCPKICVQDSEYFKDFLKKNKVVTFEDYLKQIPNETFFYFKQNRDNPKFSVPKKTDSGPVFLGHGEKYVKKDNCWK